MTATSDQRVAGNGREPAPLLDPAAPAAVDTSLRTLAGPHVALSFDVDGFTNWIGSLGALSPGPLSRGEFEHVGLPRVLALLREYRAPATFFVPGSTAVTFPHAVGAIVAEGHEIGHHGWVHEPLGRLSRTGKKRVDARPGGARSCARCPAFGLSLP